MMRKITMQIFFQSSCTIDVTYFPFDQQTCLMKFGSWTFNGDQVSLSLYNGKDFVDLSDYWKSGTWDIVEVNKCFFFKNYNLFVEYKEIN